MLAVTILGNNSAVPAFNRHPTSQVVTTDGTSFLVDCGEGTQTQMMLYKIRRSKISHIFISHLHGDHYFGLIGLLNSFGLLNRIPDLHLFAPAPLKEIIDLQLKVANNELPFNLQFHPITEERLLVDEEKYSIRCFRTNHQIECYGFSFAEKKKPRRLLPEKAKEYGIPSLFFEKLTMGEDYARKDGSIVKNEWVTEEGAKGKVYAFCADTKYYEPIIPHIKNADLIYHETTYLNNLAERAALRFHSTSGQAALIAQKAEVKKLLIGHFSSKYEKLDEFEKEAREVFANTDLALEGVTYRV